MLKMIALIPGALFLALGTACHRETMPDPVVVRVVRDPSFAADLNVPNAKFVKSEPHLRSGRRVTLDIRDDVSYWDYSQRIRAFAPSVLIFLSRESIPTASGVASQLGFPEFVCGIHPAFVPASVTGEEREAAEIYVKSIASQCPDLTPKTASTPNAEPESNQPDPNRPPCTSAACLTIKKFLKEHYCGASPFGNGPQDGCDTRGAKSHVAGTTVETEYHCNENEADGTWKCEQRGVPSSEIREILLAELQKAGVPARSEKEIHFHVLKSLSGIFLATADYEHSYGEGMDVAEVVVLVDGSGKGHLIRKLLLKKTNSDAPDVTTWDAVDVADAEGDGQQEIILEADAYEDHWFEVVRIQGDLVETIFSGLGYYL